MQIPAVVLLVVLFASWGVSAYFSYIGGVMGKRETRLLHPMGVGMMVLALTSAIVGSVQMDIWTFRSLPEFQILFLVLFVVIIAAPIGCYDAGKKELERRAKANEEDANRRFVA